MRQALQIERLGASRQQARLEECFHAVEGDLALFDGPDGRSLVRTTARARDSGVYWLVERFAVNGSSALRALDRTLFCADATAFAEIAHYRGADGTNLHEAPIRLPRVLTLGEVYRPLAGVDATVRLEHAGPVSLRSGDASHRVEAMCLVAEEGGERRLQWLARGIGEVAIAGPDGAFVRWLVGFRSDGGRTLFGGVEPALQHAARPELPATTSAAPRRSLF